MRPDQSPPVSPSWGGRKLSKPLKLVFALVALAAIAWLIGRLGPRRVLQQALEADARWLAASFIPLFLRFVLWGYKWQRILNRRQRVPFWPILQIQLAGSFVNLTTPTAKLAGGFLRAWVIHRRFGWSVASAYGRAFADQATTALGSVLLFAILAPIVYFQVPTFPWRVPVLLLGLVATLGLAILVLFRPQLYAYMLRPAVAQRLARITPSRFRKTDEEGRADWVDPVLFPFLGEGTTLRVLVPDLLWAASAFGMVCISNAFILRALGVETNIWLVSAAVVIGYFVGIAVSAWGGVGVTEAALTGLYIQFGIPPEAAAAGALLHRAAFYLVVLVWGGTAFARIEKSYAVPQQPAEG